MTRARVGHTARAPKLVGRGSAVVKPGTQTVLRNRECVFMEGGCGEAGRFLQCVQNFSHTVHTHTHTHTHTHIVTHHKRCHTRTPIKGIACRVSTAGVACLGTPPGRGLSCLPALPWLPPVVAHKIVHFRVMTGPSPASSHVHFPPQAAQQPRAETTPYKSTRCVAHWWPGRS